MIVDIENFSLEWLIFNKCKPFSNIDLLQIIEIINDEKRCILKISLFYCKINYKKMRSKW